jgi:DNA polymerase III subunit delta'
VPFRDIAGHGHLLELLGAAVQRASLPPSLIFAGPDGIGKRLTATALAQLLNCPTPVAGGRDACGLCASCTRIARLVHADVLVVEPGDTGVIKVDAVRQAIERTAYRPFEGRRRVVIVDQADALLVEAQNALLKTLEEPPAASTFVLVTSRPDVLLPTVRSRCQRLRFGRLAPADVARVLIRDEGFAEAEAHAAASVGDGSVAAALESASEGSGEAREAAANLLEAAAGPADPRRRLDGAKRLAGGSRSGGERDELARRLRAVSALLRDVGAIHARADESCLANSDQIDLLRGLASAYDAEQTVRAFAAVDRAIEALGRNASPKIVADWIALQL